MTISLTWKTSNRDPEPFFYINSLKYFNKSINLSSPAEPFRRRSVVNTSKYLNISMYYDETTQPPLI
jgi:hypothetical protein